MLGQSITSTTYQVHNASSSRFRYLAAGLHLLVTFWVLNAFFPAQGLSVEKVVISAVLLLAVLCFALQIIFVSNKIRTGKFDFISGVLLVLLFIWCVVTIVRGFEDDAGRLFTLLANPEIGGLVWLLPFAVYIGRQPGVLEALLPTFRVHALIGIALVLWTIAAVYFSGILPQDNYSKVGLVLLYGAPVALLTGMGSRFDRWIYLAGLALSALAHYVLHHRTGVAETIVILMLAMALGQKRNLKGLSIRLMVLTLVALAAGIMGLDSLLSKLDESWFVDTRTFLWTELHDDFSFLDWIFGRGALGSYYSPYFALINREHISGGDWMYRQVNEIGYLHIALKAGLIGIFLYFAAIARAIYKSIFITDKRLTVGMMLLLSLHLVEMTIIGQASFLPSRVLLWIMAGIAISRPANEKNRAIP